MEGKQKLEGKGAEEVCGRAFVRARREEEEKKQRQREREVGRMKRDRRVLRCLLFLMFGCLSGVLLLKTIGKGITSRGDNNEQSGVEDVKSEEALSSASSVESSILTTRSTVSSAWNIISAAESTSSDQDIYTNQNIINVTQAVLSLTPRIILFRKIATDEEVDKLKEIASKRLKRSDLAFAPNENVEEQKKKQSDTRTSDGTFVQSQEDDSGLISGLEERISRILMKDTQTFEAWNVLRYRHNEHYYGHYDYFDPAQFQMYVERPSLQRQYTLLLYLTDVEKGGETVFPFEDQNRLSYPNFKYESCEFGIKVHPHKGDAVFFESLKPNLQLDTYALHAGCPVEKGEKWVATKWIEVGDYPRAV